MPEAIRNLQKQGAQTRAINASIRDVMKMIEENRKKKQEEDAEKLRLKKEQQNNKEANE